MTTLDREQQRRAIRRRLFHQVVASTDPRSYATTQRALAAALIEAETASSKGDPLRERHLRLLRVIGDGIPWQLLAPHVIRQLSKNDGHPPSLSSQGPAFEKVLDSVTALAEHDALVIASDLTHCLRIGDLVVVNSRDSASLMEMKSGKKRAPRGRAARQMIRMATALDTSGTDESPNVRGVQPLIIKTPTTPDADHFATVERLVAEASKVGFAQADVDEFDTILVMRGDPREPLSDVTPRPAGTRRMAFLHVDRLLDPPAHVCPVTAWPISIEARELLLESDVVIVHLVDLRGLEQDTVHGRVRLSGDAAAPLVIERDDHRFLVTWSFIDRVGFDFQTLASARARLSELVDEGFAAAQRTNAEPESEWAYLRRRREEGKLL